MKTVLCRIAISIGIVLLWIPGSSCFAKAEKNALIIGNSSYKTAGLANPVNDATDMADTLRKLGFKVTLKTNATQKAMEESKDRHRNRGLDQHFTKREEGKQK